MISPIVLPSRGRSGQKAGRGGSIEVRTVADVKREALSRNLGSRALILRSAIAARIDA
jgi:hypothetical protein